MGIVYSLNINKLVDNDRKVRLFDELGGKNFQHKIVDLSEIFYKTRKNEKCDVYISNLKELDELIQKNKFFIINFSIDIIYYSIVNVLNKYANEKVFFQINSQKLPLKNLSITNNPTMFLKRALSKPSRIVNYFYNKYFIKIEPIVFETGRKSSAKNFEIPSFQFSEVQKNYNKLNQNNIVFLDENLIHHPDFEILSEERIENGEHYIKSLEAFLTRLGRSKSLSPKIALHPRTKVNSFSNKIESRIYETLNLVKESEIVVAHASTSIHYAIILNKSLLLTTTNELNKISRIRFIEPYSEELNIPIINIDEFNDFENIDSYINKSEYRKYMDKYIISNNLEADSKTHEIVNSEIDKIIASK
jgi:hypothetical protein